jgi:hypothetical protein
MAIADSEPTVVELPADPSGLPQGADGTVGRIVIPVFTRPKAKCGPPGKGDEIVVCAEDQERFRLRPLPDTYERQPATGGPEADLGGGVTLKQDLEQVDIGGTQSKRIMVRAKIKF